LCAIPPPNVASAWAPPAPRQGSVVVGSLARSDQHRGGDDHAANSGTAEVRVHAGQPLEPRVIADRVGPNGYTIAGVAAPVGSPMAAAAGVQ
jgi:hypothetical protein